MSEFPFQDALTPAKSCGDQPCSITGKGSVAGPMTDQTRAVLDAATPRPWKRGQNGNVRLYGPAGSGRDATSLAEILLNGRQTANAALIVEAVNSYEAREQLIDSLTEALRKVSGELGTIQMYVTSAYAQLRLHEDTLSGGDLRGAVSIAKDTKADCEAALRERDK